jgi:hypothetical protein
MPWKSKKQEAWGNSPAGHEALGDAGVDEWNHASKGKKLPKTAKHPKHEEHDQYPMAKHVSRLTRKE